jgi:ribosomal protein L40E
MKIHLSTIRCRYCEHANPADAKFCSACGGELHLPPHLTSCLRCGTVNPVIATACIWCRSPLPRSTAGSSPAAPPRRTSRAVVGALVLATIGALAYYGYRQVPLSDAPEPGTAGGEAATGAKSADANDTSSQSGNPLAASARAATIQPRAGRQTVESQEGKPAAAAITRSQTIEAGNPGEPEPSRQYACTEAVAALGLCETKPDAGKVGGQEPSRAQACTSAAAALGLCAPRTTQGRE